MKRLIISLFTVIWYLTLLFSPGSHAFQRESFYQKYGVSPEGLILHLNQTDARSYGDAQNWYNLTGLDHFEQPTASYQPTITGAVALAGTCRDFDGNDNFMAQKEYADEDGATFWPTNAGGIFAPNEAAFRVAGVDLAALYASAGNKYILVVHDGSDKTAFGYMDLADSAIAYGATVLDDDCADDDTGDWTAVDCTLVFDDPGSDPHYVVTETAISQHVHQSDSLSFTVSKLYEIKVDIKEGTDSAVPLVWRIGSAAISFSTAEISLGNVGTASWVTHTKYFIGKADTDSVDLFFNTIGSGKTLLIRNILCREVTHVGTDGTLIMSTKGGSTQSWTYKESGIDLNDIDSFEVLKSDFQITGDLSVFMWVKPDDGIPGSDEILITKWRSVDGFRSFAFDILSTTGKLRADFSSDGASNSENEDTDAAFFSNGQETWHHVGFVYTAGASATCIIYGDGVALDSAASGPGIPAALFDVAEKLTIGALSTPANYFAGLIGPDIHLFERAITAAEVQKLYNEDRKYFSN